MPEILTGLDVGSSQVKCVVAEKQKNGILRVLTAFKHPSSGFRRGVLVDTEDALQLFENIISELRDVSKEAVRNVFLNVQSEHAKVRISRGISAVSQPDKEIKQEDVDRAVQSSRAAKILPNYKVLHTIIREFFVDEVGDIQNPVGMSGSRLEVSTLIVEAFSPHFDVLVQTAGRAGASIGGVIFNPFAASHAILNKRQKELGVLMLDLGSGTTSLAVFGENKPIFAKSFPVGSSHITSDIAVGLRVNFEAAEKIKQAFGVASVKGSNRKETVNLAEVDTSLSDEIPKRFLADIVGCRVAQIIDVINNELKPLKQHFQFPAGVVVTGGGVKLDGVIGLLRDGLKLPVQIGLPDFNNFEIENPAIESVIDDSEFTTALGLVLFGRDDGKERSVNFFDSLKRIIKNLAP